MNWIRDSFPNRRLQDDRDFLVEMGSAAAAAFGELAFLLSALLQSGGVVYYRVNTSKIVDGVKQTYYHIEHTNIGMELAAAVLLLILVQLILAVWSWRRNLNLMRIVIPVSLLLFAGIMSQAFIHPTGLRKHLLTMLPGLAACVFAVFFVNAPLRKQSFHNICVLLIPVSLFCLVYGFFHLRNGNGSWVFGVQPGEFFKLAMLVLCCVGFHFIRTDAMSRICFFSASGAMFAAVLGARDLGNALIIAGLLLIVLASLGLWKLAVGIAAGGTASGLLLCRLLTRFSPSNRIVQRLSQSLFYPVAHYENSQVNQNLRQAVLALVRGGLLGTGVQDSDSLYAGSIYASQTDFIFAAGTSLFGFLFGVTVLAAFLALAANVSVTLRETRSRHHDLYQANILVCLLLLQSMVHILGSLSLIPMTGVTLPFISAGGSSMLASLAAAGVLIGYYLPERYRASLARRSSKALRRLPQAPDMAVWIGGKIAAWREKNEGRWRRENSAV